MLLVTPALFIPLTLKVWRTTKSRCLTFHVAKFLIEKIVIPIRYQCIHQHSFLKSWTQRSENEATCKKLDSQRHEIHIKSTFSSCVQWNYTLKHTCVSDILHCAFGIVAFQSYENNANAALFFAFLNFISSVLWRKKSLILEDWKLDLVHFFTHVIYNVRCCCSLLPVRKVRMHIENKFLNIMKLFACFFSAYQMLLHSTTNRWRLNEYLTNNSSKKRTENNTSERQRRKNDEI